MIICPWCGTNYESFQSNCKNCGGPLQAPAWQVRVAEDGAVQLAPPPPAPRDISDRYTWRLLLTSGPGIAGLIFAILGVSFFFLGFILTVAIVTAVVGIPFLMLGMTFLVLGVGLLVWRYEEAQKVVKVLRFGQAICGQVTGVHENPMMRVNNRHPWTVDYQFQVNGQPYSGKVSSLNPPGVSLQPGKPAYILFMPENPEQNALYPHP